MMHYLRRDTTSLMLYTNLRDAYLLFYNWALNFSMLSEHLDNFTISRTVKKGFAVCAKKAFSYLPEALPDICHRVADTLEFCELNGIDHSSYNRYVFRSRVRVNKLVHGLYVLVVEDGERHERTFTISAPNAVEALWKSVPVINSMLGYKLYVQIDALIDRHGHTTWHRNTGRKKNVNKRRKEKLTM